MITYNDTQGLDLIIKIEAEHHNMPLKEAMQVFITQTNTYGLLQGTLNTIDYIKQYEGEQQ